MTALPKHDMADEIAAHRPLLYRLALLQLGDPAAAEDATQDALLAAIQKIDGFEGRASLRTWMVSILRFKVLDILRTKKRHGPTLAPDDLARELDIKSFEGLFDETGCWATTKDAWSDPETHLAQIEFFKILEACMTRLPTNTSRVFLMRSWLELSPEEVCEKIGVSRGNLRVLLYRARMQLRECLDDNWSRDQ